MTIETYVQDVTTAGFVSEVVERSRTVPVLVDFWATWCGPCRALGPILERLAAEYAGGFLLAKVDTDREPALASQFQIRSIPTVMLFRDGQPVGGFPGALPEGQVRALLTQHGVEVGGAPALVLADDPAERVVQLQDAIVAQPTREALRLDLALAVLSLGDIDRASTLLEALPATVYSDPRALRARARVALCRHLPRHNGHETAQATEQVTEQATAPHAVAAIRAVLDGDEAGGIAGLLDLLRAESAEEAALARTALVEALQLSTDDGLVRESRRRMAAALF